MYKPFFFPNAEFGWGFLALLTATLAVAAYVDWRRTVIPKWLTFTLLGLGVAASVARGAWLGANESGLWLFSSSNLWLGALDGFLFAVVGCLAGFAMIFVLWVLGTCGGGDVKLFAALGAWVGPVYAIFVLLASLIVLFFEVLVKIVTGGGLKAVRRMAKSEQEKKGQPRGWRVTYSLPLAIATVVVVLWFFRVDLKLAESRTPPDSPKVQANAR